MRGYEAAMAVTALALFLGVVAFGVLVVGVGGQQARRSPVLAEQGQRPTS